MEKEHPINVKYRLSYNGGWYEAPITKAVQKKKNRSYNPIAATQFDQEENRTSTQHQNNVFTMPATVYEGKEIVFKLCRK